MADFIPEEEGYSRAPAQNKKTDVAPDKSEDFQKADGKSYFGIKVKKNVSAWNVFAPCYVFIMLCSLGGFMNVQMIYLLIDPLYFDVSPEHIGRTTANIIVISTAVGLSYAPISGQLFDIFMRKWLLFSAGIVGALAVFVCPFTAPSVFLMMVVRIVV